MSEREKSSLSSGLHSVERLQAAVATHAIGIFETNPRTSEVYWNSEMQQIFGYEPGTFPGTLAAWHEHLLPEDERRLKRAFETAMTHGSESLRYTYQMRRRDGELRHIEASVQFYYDESGRNTRRVGVNVDVTDRVSEQARWRAMFNQMHEGFIACELIYGADGVPIDYRYLEANGPAELLSGVPATDSIGRGAYELHPQLEKFWLKKFVQVVETGEPTNFTHFAAPLARWFDVHAYRYTENQFAVLFLDVTEQKTLATKAREAQRTLMKSVRLNAIGAMATTLAHELNQPLGAAANYLGAIKLILSSSEKPDFVAIGEAAAAATSAHLRAGEIIKRMKSFALEGRVATTVEHVSEIIASAAREFLTEPPGQGVLMHLDVDTELTVMADKVQLEQVFTNLFRNAAAAMRDQEGSRQITVVGRPKGRSVHISVEDTGPGISNDYLARIFEPFRSTTAGMGLGLAICRTIIEAHGGDLQARSPHSGGAVFSIRLPMAQSPHLITK